MPKRNKNDRAASQVVASQFRALKDGERMWKGLRSTIRDTAGDELDEKSAVRLGRITGEDLNSELDAFARGRVSDITDRLSRTTGMKLKVPKLRGLPDFLGSDPKALMNKAGKEAARGFSLSLFESRAKTIARSGAAAAHNAAVMAVALANRKFVIGVMAVATLDMRTTAYCIDMHGSVWDLNGKRLFGTSAKWPGRPPWHWNCRTTLVPIFKGDLPDASLLTPDEWFKSPDAREAMKK